jgi:signal peptidase
VEGYHNGYSKFGEYGDVIIYERLNAGNPIIHRAILWLDYDDGKWSAPSLEHFADGSGDPLWSNGNNTDFMDLTGMLTLRSIGYSSKTVYADLSDMHGESGYLTMGDNGVTNRLLDQYNSDFSKNRLVSYDRILCVAGFEIPWIGCIKLYASGDTGDIPPNSIPMLIVTLITIICIAVVSSFGYDRITKRGKENNKDDNEEERESKCEEEE